MANTIINFKRGNGLNIIDPTSNPTGLSNTVLDDSSYTLGPHSIETASPWFNKEAYQFWVDGVCINPALVAGKGISLGALEWDEDTNNNPTSKLINTIDVKLSNDPTNSLSMKDDGLYLAAAEAGSTMIYRFNSLVTHDWEGYNDSSTQADASVLGNINVGVVLQGGTQIIQENDDGTTDTIETWGTLPSTPSDAPFNFHIRGGNLDPDSFMPGLADYLGPDINSYQYGYTLGFTVKSYDADGTPTPHSVINIPINKCVVLKTIDEDTGDHVYTLYEGNMAKGSWTIPTDAERFAKSIKIVTITIDTTTTPATYWDNSNPSSPIEVTADNSDNIIEHIATGDKVIRLEVVNVDEDSSNYLYLGVDGLFSYETLSTANHSSTESYIIKGSGYTTATADPLKVLREDGSWNTIPVFGGATAPTNTSTGVNGTSGLVPAPSVSQANYVLRGDGSWAPLSLDALNYTTQDSSSDEYNGINIQLNDSSDLLHWWQLKASNQPGDTSINFNASIGQTTGNTPINYPTIELMIDVIDGGSF